MKFSIVGWRGVVVSAYTLVLADSVLVLGSRVALYHYYRFVSGEKVGIRREDVYIVKHSSTWSPPQLFKSLALHIACTKSSLLLPVLGFIQKISCYCLNPLTLRVPVIK